MDKRSEMSPHPPSEGGENRGELGVGCGWPTV